VPPAAPCPVVCQNPAVVVGNGIPDSFRSAQLTSESARSAKRCPSGVSRPVHGVLTGAADSILFERARDLLLGDSTPGDSQ